MDAFSIESVFIGVSIAYKCQFVARNPIRHHSRPKWLWYLGLWRQSSQRKKCHFCTRTKRLLINGEWLNGKHFSFIPGQPREKWMPCHNTYLAKINRKSIIIIVVKCAANGITRISCGQLRRQQQILAHHAHLAKSIEHFCRISSNCAICSAVANSAIIELPSTSGFYFV